MSKKREASETPPPPPNDLADDALEILLKEYDALRDLYSRAEASAQSMFNFYLTLLSSIVGAVVVIFQFSSDDLRGTYFTLSALLFFAASIGAVYLSAVSSRYGHMARYARAIDALRRVLLERAKRLLPPLYAPFLARSASSFRTDQRVRPRIGWLLPSGSFQFFIAILNSAALAGSTWFLLMALGVVGMQPVRALITCALIFGIAFNVFNIYAHLAQQTIIQRLNVDLYTHDQLAFLAGKE